MNFIPVHDRTRAQSGSDVATAEAPQSHRRMNDADSQASPSADAARHESPRIDPPHAIATAEAEPFDGTLSDVQVQRIAKAIADPQRFTILSFIAEQAELPCKTLVATLSIKQATISHHLKELAAAQLIESRKEGQRAILSCRRDVCDAYVRALESRLSCAESKAS